MCSTHLSSCRQEVVKKKEISEWHAVEEAWKGRQQMNKRNTLIRISGLLADSADLRTNSQ